MNDRRNGKIMVKDQYITEQYSIYNDDCIKVMKGIPDEKIGFSIFSPPFADLYAYSDDVADLGNSNYQDFFKHFTFVVKDLFRVLIPGRVVGIHCMDLPVHKANEGYIGLKDFSGDIIRLFQSNGFVYHSRHCVWKDPLIAATRTKAIGLAHKQIVKDSAMCRMGIPDYILAFRKDGENPHPIAHPKGLTEYAGTRQIPWNLERFLKHLDPKTNKRSHWIWQQCASPVWDDIDQTKILPFRGGREEDDQRHVCPLQLQVVERCLVLWSNPGDVVLSPFAGVGTEIFESVRLGRKGIGVELKRGYFRQMKKNLESLKHKKNQAQFNMED